MSNVERPDLRVTIVEAALGTARMQGRDIQVIRGTLDPKYFDAIVVPDYQRVAMTTGKHHELIAALGPDGIGVPDGIMLCMRDTRYQAVGANQILLVTPALYLLDGHQRVDAALERLRQGLWTQPFGVTIYLGTTKKEEIYTFYQINRLQTPVTTNVFLRNSDESAALRALREMAESTPGFPPIQWDQQKQPGDLITARLLYEIAVVLHGYARKGSFEQILAALDKLTDKIGTERLADNVRSFFDVVRDCFGTGGSASFMYRADLLRGLAMLFNEYQEFWDKSGRLLVARTERKKLGTLKRDELESALRTRGEGRAVYLTLRHHVEKGRKRPLTDRGADTD